MDKQDEKILDKKIECLKLAYEGLKAEFDYVNCKKNEKIRQDEIKFQIEKENNDKELKSRDEKIIELEKYYKKELEKYIKETESYRSELDAIKNSRWWKLRGKIKKIIR